MIDTDRKTISFEMADRGVTNLVSALLITAITVVGIGTLTVASYQHISDTREKTSSNVAESQIIRLGGAMEDAAVKPQAVEQQDINLGEQGGAITISNSTTSLEVRMGTPTSTGTTNRCEDIYASPPCPNKTVETTTFEFADSQTVYNEQVGSLQYYSEYSQTNVQYELGGVFKSSQTIAQQTIDNPALEYRRAVRSGRPNTVAFQIMNIDPGPNPSLSRAAFIRSEGQGEVIDREHPSPGFVEQGEAVQIRITSQYADAWSQYIRDEFPETATNGGRFHLQVQGQESADRQTVVFTIEAPADGFYMNGIAYKVQVQG